MPGNVIDLDILRPESRMVKIGKETIDVSFVPCGITFEVDDIVSQLTDVVLAMEKETNLKGEDAVRASAKSPLTKVAFELGVKLCVLFCSMSHPEMDEAWFMENTAASQVGIMSDEIQVALTASFKGVDDYQKKTAPSEDKGKK